MRIPSSISIVLTAPSTSDTSTSTSTSDSGSDTGPEGRSIRRHIKLRTASSSPGRSRSGSGCRKDLLSASATPVIVDHTETTARNSRLNIQTRSRGSSGSSLLNPAVGIAHHVSSENLPQPSAQGPEGREGGIGPGPLGGSADNPSAPHYTIPPVDQSFVSLITTHIFATSFSHGSWQR